MASPLDAVFALVRSRPWRAREGDRPDVHERRWGLIPVAGLLHRNQMLARLADTIRSVYGRPQPPEGPATVYRDATSQAGNLEAQS